MFERTPPPEATDHLPAADARLRAALDLFAEVCDLENDARDQALQVRCGNDAELLARVQVLVRRDRADRLAQSSVGHAVQTGGGAQLAMSLVTRADRSPLPLLQGRYRILGLLGEGGMGTVYEAEQTSPRRLVALKSLRPSAFGGEQALRRFALEADVLARLQHPAIAQVYEAGFGEDDAAGPAWIAMELVRGKPLVAAVQAQNLPRRARLDVFLRVCDGVSFAHQKGVIHRDLKPGNILLGETETDDTGDGPVVKILDFGVARVLGDGWGDLTALTGPGQMVGTLPYMSPEQVAGDPDAVDVRTDVYALGVVLFELLVGRRPFDLSGRGAQEAIRIVRDDAPPSSSSIDPTLKGDLDAIVSCALAKDPRQRYQSVALLAEDIRSHLAGAPVAARSNSRWYVIARHARRSKTPIAIALCVVVAVIAFAVRASIEATRQTELAAEAESATTVAEAAKTVLAEQLSSARLEQARLLSAHGNVPTAMEIVSAEATHRNDSHIQWATRDIAARHPCVATMQTHTGPVHLVALVGDGSLLLSAAEDACAVLSDAEGRVITSAELGSPATAGAYDASRERVVVGLADGRVDALDAYTLAPHGTIARHSSAVRAVACFDGMIASGSVGGSLIVTGEDGHAVLTRKRASTIGALAFLDVNTLILGDDAGEVVRIDLDDGESRVIEHHDGFVGSVLADRLRRRVLSGSGDRTMRVLDPDTGREIALIDVGNGTVRGLGVDDATGDLFSCGWWSMDRWDRRFVAKRRVASPPDSPYCAQFDTAIGLAITGHRDGVIRLWSVQSNAVNGGGLAIAGLEGRPTCALSPDGSLLACGDGEGSLLVYDARAGVLIAPLPSHARRARSVAFDATGSMVVSAGDDGVLQIADARTGSPIARARGVEPVTTSSVAFSPNGRLVAATFSDRSVRILSVPALDVVATLPLGSQQALSAAWSPDGRVIATTARDQMVRLWSVDGTELAQTKCVEIPWALAFSSDGASLAVSTWGRVIDLYDGTSLALTRRLTGAAGLMTSVVWLASTSTDADDGPMILASSADGTLRVWDPRDGRELFEFTPFVQGEVVSCSADASGSTIAATGGAGESACWSLRRWDAWAKTAKNFRKSPE
ncbi:MAG: protein kinase [Phycisphaerae bacterium]|nr:protein kinase [Phycisphaerae bacterium]